jgi:hypothetical protein
VITTGQAIVHNYVTQDCIHVIDSTKVTIRGNILDSGNLTNSGTNVGDDCICIQGVNTGSSNVTITGNTVVASAARGITVVNGGALVRNVTITGNTIENTQHEGITLEYDNYSSGLTLRDITITGNSFYNLALSGSGRGITVQDATNAPGGHTGPGWKTLAIKGNTFDTFTNTSGGGIYVGQGDNLTISGNVFSNWNSLRGIQVGDNGGTSQPVTNFSVTGNTIDMSASAATSPAGILVIDSQDGTIAGNTVTGPGSGVSGSIGIRLLKVGAAVTGVAVTGNRTPAWQSAITEDTGSDYNTIVGNNCHSCTNFVTTSGAHDVVASNVVA